MTTQPLIVEGYLDAVFDIETARWRPVTLFIFRSNEQPVMPDIQLGPGCSTKEEALAECRRVATEWQAHFKRVTKPV